MADTKDLPENIRDLANDIKSHITVTGSTATVDAAAYAAALKARGLDEATVVNVQDAQTSFQEALTAAVGECAVDHMVKDNTVTAVVATVPMGKAVAEVSVLHTGQKPNGKGGTTKVHGHVTTAFRAPPQPNAKAARQIVAGYAAGLLADK